MGVASRAANPAACKDGRRRRCRGQRRSGSGDCRATVATSTVAHAATTSRCEVAEGVSTSSPLAATCGSSIGFAKVDADVAVKAAIAAHTQKLEAAEDQAAEAAAALLRRLAGVGIETSPEEAARRWEAIAQKAVERAGCWPETAAGFADADGGCSGIEDSVQRCVGDVALVAGGGLRRVRFSLSPADVHYVTPYSEVYGVHPREFVFGRNFRVLPSGGAYGFVDAAAAATVAAAAAQGVLSVDEDEDAVCSSDSSSAYESDDAESDDEGWKTWIPAGAGAADSGVAFALHERFGRSGV
eukprot:TRINITY_DN54812_c0_g1_i1.p1 TRINITY_DN54812_c0_g1~~TRINITY_DN54812_c0_g1_i1.p1  ORF type:complete len:299 (+),score=62.00 TRINITY_DN54812_c0_g1_i1:61-957(+)